MKELINNIKPLGFGLMRLPMKETEVDIEQTKQMVDLFLAKGFTYFDTAYGYINGKSEEAIKTALVDRYPRESFLLATKLPAWAGPTTAKEAEDMFWTSLKRTGVEYFDFYLLHNLGGNRSEFFDRFGIWDFLARQKAEGRIKHLGFSMHDTADKLDEILTNHPEMEFVQLQINYADWNNGIIQSGKCYKVARKHGKPIIVMEPVKGGMLAELPPPVAEIFDQADPVASPSSWAIRYAASLEGVITVLSGMSNMEQMQDNVATMENFSALDANERAVVSKAQAALAEIDMVPCTNCQYCLKGCPQNINIPGTFKVFNDYLLHRDAKIAKASYGWETSVLAPASACVACGACEKVCPQSIHIIDELEMASEVLC